MGQDILDLQLVGAVLGGREDLALELIERGANVNRQDAQGMTVLHHTAARGARQAVRALVASGKCDYLIRDHMNRYAFELAREWGRDEATAELLEKKHVQQASARGVPAYVPRG